MRSQRPSLALIFLVFAAVSAARLRAQCSCTNCPQLVPDGFSGNFIISVSGSTNNVLGQNGQGVCAVNINFSTSYIGDLTIALVSPGNDTVQLTGPQGFFNTTSNSAWDISFVPCSAIAQPDAGFLPTFSNAQNWGLFGDYAGSYYPFYGCLEDFDGGPVNGEWKLIVTDGQDFDAGLLSDWSIEFCDPSSGINCFSCAANAGLLPQPDVLACLADSSLNLTLPPTYPTGQAVPPAPAYAYAYVLAGTGGVIQAYLPKPDLRAYVTGSYTVCGISYLAADQAKLPAPGTTTVQALTQLLNGGTPPFCGKITTNCVNVSISAPVPDETMTATICAPDSFQFHGQWFRETGIYALELAAGGCEYTATLGLTVAPTPNDTIREYRCGAGCSAVPGFANACATGVYQNFGQTAAGCDSTITLIFTLNEVAASIAPPLQLPCGNTSIALDGSGSTSGADILYAWWSTPGGNFTSATNAAIADVNKPGGYALSVCRPNADGSACCDTASVVVQQNNAAPAPPAAIVGDMMACLGESLNYSTSLPANATSISWSVPSGVSVTGGQNTPIVSVFWNTDQSGQMCASAVNACGSSSSTCLNVNALQPPDLVAIAGDSIICAGATEVYSVPNFATPTTYNWTISPGATLLAGQNTSLIQINWGMSGGGQICCEASNACDGGPKICLNVVEAPPLSAPVIAGPTATCSGLRDTFFVQNIPGATGYAWSVPTGASIVSGQNSPKIIVNWGNSAGGNICVRASGPCSNSPQTCFPVAVERTPTANAGAGGAVCGQNFSLGAQLSAAGNTGIWAQISGPSTANFANANAAVTAVSAPAPGNYLFQWIENQGICTDTATVAVRFNELPAPGQPVASCDQIRENFWVEFLLYDGLPPYNIPGGSNNGDNFVSQFLPTGSAYTFVVTDANGCTASVTGSHSCSCVTSAGTMNAAPLSACEGQIAIAGQPVGKKLDANDVGVFVLHDQPGAVLGQIFAVSANGAFGWQPGMAFEQTYFISFVAGNDSSGFPKILGPCFAVAPGQPVVFHQKPAANAGTDATICGLLLPLAAQPSVGAGQWSVAQTPPGGSLSFSSQNATATASASMPGTYRVAWTENNNGCTSQDFADLIFHPTPTAGLPKTTCDSAGENFTVEILVFGGTAPFAANGQPFSGNSFISNQLPSGSTFSFQISDANGCAAAPVAGAHDCQCTTWAGTMSGQILTACANDSVQAQATGNAILDGNDAGAFVLHDQPGTALGNVLAQNATGKFGLAAGMVFGQTYYISFVAGDALGGQPDPSGKCFSVAPGQPVRFLPLPPADAGRDTVVCGLALDLGANASQSGTWTVASNPPGGTAIFSDSQNPAATLHVSLAGWYDLLWSVSADGCTAADTVRAGFFFAPVAAPITFECDGASENFRVNIAVSGGTSPYFVNGQPLAGSPFLSNFLPNGSTFNFQITDANDCPAALVNGSHECDCATDAGTMSSQPIAVCGLQNPAQATQAGDTNLDTNDIGAFILHDGTAASVGQILATNASGQFSFLPNMAAGQTYFICFAAGNDAGGAPNPGERCYEVSNGQPVVWQPEITANVLPTAQVCNAPTGGSVLNFNDLVTGGDLTGAWSGPAGIGAGALPVLDFDGTPPGIYAFTYTTSAAVLPCQNLAYTTLVEVKDCACPPLEFLPAPALCNAGGALDLSNLEKNVSQAGAWQITQAPTGPSPAVLVGKIFDANGSDAGSYEITYRLDDAPPPGCPASASQILMVKKSVSAGVASLPEAICAGENKVFDLISLLPGADTGGAWAEISTPKSTGAAFSSTAGTFATASQQPGDYTFIYMVSADAPCPNDTARVEIRIHPQPNADAGPDRELDCLTPSAVLGSSGTSAWPGLIYEWRLAGNAVPGADSVFFQTSQVGDFQLVVRDTASNCAASDETSVNGTVEFPMAESIAVGHLRCSGDADGWLEIGIVAGGQPPYQFSLNGGPLNGGRFFGNLDGGNYVVEIEDALGCSWLSDTVQIIEPEALAVNLGADLQAQAGELVWLEAEIFPAQAAIDTLVWSSVQQPQFSGKAYQEIYAAHSEVFVLTAIDTNGCRASDEILLIVDATRRVFVPNAFAPNSENNSRLTVFGGKDIEKVESFEIFDRWGERLFEAKDFQANELAQGWDGKFRGKLASAGVYVFLAKIKFRDGTTEIFTGDIALLR